MKALAASKSSLEALSIQDLPDPVPARGEVRVRVQHSAINPADAKVIEGKLDGFILHGAQAPVVTGYDFSGTVDALGPDVMGVSVGQRVYGFLPYARSTKRGAFAELIVATPAMFAPLPEGLDSVTAAALATGGCTALQALRDLGGLKAGGHVLVIGAAGGVGSVAVGVAKAMGARVSAVCSVDTFDLVRSLGADQVYDRKGGEAYTGDPRYDVVFDAPCVQSYGGTRAVLAPGGAYLTTLPSAALVSGMVMSRFSGHRCAMIVVKNSRADLEQLAGWVARGLKVPIDSVRPVRELADAIARQAKGGVRGKVVIDVAGGF